MNLFYSFKNSADCYPDNKSIVVDGEACTYSDLYKVVCKISFILKACSFENIGIFSYRSLSTYAGILAAVKSGMPYVPLNPKFPKKRNQTIINLADLSILIVDKSCISHLADMADGLPASTIVIAPELSLSEIPVSLRSTMTVYSKEALVETENNIAEVHKDDIAYIMFTSGSTGVPKGVPVSHFNVLEYISNLMSLCEISQHDRFSQTFDITFDLSVHDMFLAWNAGASVYVVPENVLMAPARFIKENELTMWFSVPSLAQVMHRLKMLKNNAFPTLRYSLFCGEPLPKQIATAWGDAAPNSILVNIYGPTEATIGITQYVIPRENDKILEKNGIVSIGKIFETQEFCLINELGEKVEKNGELCLSGTQVTRGYLNNSKKTKDHFFSFPGDQKTWYKTGDFVAVENNSIFYLSRVDFQVKIRGYRIELDEINLAIRKFTNASIVHTIPYPINDGLADNLYSFVDSNCKNQKYDILNHLRTILPDYMVPKDVIFLKDFPLNMNGKIDRNKLVNEIK